MDQHLLQNLLWLQDSEVVMSFSLGKCGVKKLGAVRPAKLVAVL